MLIFAPAKFFLFLVRRNSANSASPRPRKSFAGCTFVRGSGAKLSEFRLGGVTKTPRGEALSSASSPRKLPYLGSPSLQLGSSRSALAKPVAPVRLRCPKLPPATFGQLMRFGFVQPLRFAALTGVQNSWVWVLSICRVLDTGCKMRPSARSVSAGRWMNGRLSALPKAES
jgi:hypothetical protein